MHTTIFVTVSICTSTTICVTIYALCISVPEYMLPSVSPVESLCVVTKRQTGHGHVSRQLCIYGRVGHLYLKLVLATVVYIYITTAVLHVHCSSHLIFEDTHYTAVCIRIRITVLWHMKTKLYIVLFRSVVFTT